MEIYGKDIKITEHVLGKGVTGKVYFADCYGFDAAAKVNGCLDGKIIFVAYTIGPTHFCTCPVHNSRQITFVRS